MKKDLKNERSKRYVVEVLNDISVDVIKLASLIQVERCYMSKEEYLMFNATLAALCSMQSFLYEFCGYSVEG